MAGSWPLAPIITALLWNYLHLSPWIGIPLAMLAAVVAAVLIGYPRFRFRITGHYFALLTLALSAIVLQVITATRDITGGSLGYTPERYRWGISPDTVSGIGVSLQMVFAAVVGGLYVPLGPTVGAVITIMLTETLRIWFGTTAVDWDNLVYGTLLALFIIFLPQGLLGSVPAMLTRREVVRHD